MIRRSVAALLALLLLVAPATAAVVQRGGTEADWSSINLSTAQTGNADSTNTLDRGTIRRAALLKIVSTVGGTPTVTVNIQGSMDGASWYNVGYALSATPETVAVAAITITSATTGYYILRPEHPWRFQKLVYSANTNVTLTVDIWA